MPDSDVRTAALPSGLVRSNRQPADLPDVIEIWFAPR